MIFSADYGKTWFANVVVMDRASGKSMLARLEGIRSVVVQCGKKSWLAGFSVN